MIVGSCGWGRMAGGPAAGIAATPAAGGFLGVEDCGAIADAAVEAVSELLAAWAAGTEGAE